eukprot:TRINITY_DN7273_c0_g1_i2.p1 TRINITY_DN7273_c0_g1~~TRINITY_DN7273_c0_g1_i2.p1  ORF type:complete len:179 (-),score=37.15 TRINITY_DN7273_c0_g1_i2:204-740(-)
MSVVKRKELLVAIDGDVFELSKFVSNHPGEGIQDIYLRNYNRKEVSSEYVHYHFDDEPDKWLDAAREKKFDPETGIYYVGPIAGFFKRNIPPYFHFLPDDVYAIEYMKDAPAKSFIVRPSQSAPTTSLSATSKDETGAVHSVRLNRDGSQWSTKSGVSAGSLEELVDKLFVQQSFTAA